MHATARKCTRLLNLPTSETMEEMRLLTHRNIRWCCVMYSSPHPDIDPAYCQARSNEPLWVFSREAAAARAEPAAKSPPPTAPSAPRSAKDQPKSCTDFVEAAQEPSRSSDVEVPHPPARPDGTSAAEAHQARRRSQWCGADLLRSRSQAACPPARRRRHADLSCGLRGGSPGEDPAMEAALF